MYLFHILYTRFMGIAHHRVLQTSRRGWADSKAVHGTECNGGAHALLEIPLSRGCCLKCTVLPVQEVCSPTQLNANQANELSTTTEPRSCAWAVYIAGDTLRHQPMGAGHMTVFQLRGPIACRVLQWGHPMLG